MRFGRKQAKLAPSRGREKRGVARALEVGALMFAAIARRRKCADAETKLRPRIWVAHCSGVCVLCVWPNGVTAS